MKLGLESYHAQQRTGSRRRARPGGRAGTRGVLFELSPFESFRDDDLAAIRHAAEEQGLYVEFGMGSILRWHPMAEKGRRLLAEAGYDVGTPRPNGHPSPARRPKARLAAPPLRGRQSVHPRRGLRHGRAGRRAVAILREACRAAEDLGMKIAMETHADFTVRELASILARVDSPAFGFTVDCANLAFDLDNPLRLAAIVAPHALTTPLQELPHHPHAGRAGIGELRLGRGRDRHRGDCRTAGQTQPADQSEYRNPFAIRALSAGHFESRLVGEAPLAACRRSGLVLGKIVGQDPAGRFARQPSRRSRNVGA